GARQAADVGEGAAVAPAGEQPSLWIDGPALGREGQDAFDVGRVLVLARYGPGRAGGGRRDQDGAVAARVPQPAPQEGAAVAAAAVQGDHQRPGAVGVVVFGNVDREAAALFPLVVEVEDAGPGRRAGGREAGQEVAVGAAGRLDEVAADRRHAGQRIERLLGAGEVAQGA